MYHSINPKRNDGLNNGFEKTSFQPKKVEQTFTMPIRIDAPNMELTCRSLGWNSIQRVHIILFDQFQSNVKIDLWRLDAILCRINTQSIKAKEADEIGLELPLTSRPSAAAEGLHFYLKRLDLKFFCFR